MPIPRVVLKEAERLGPNLGELSKLPDAILLALVSSGLKNAQVQNVEKFLYKKNYKIKNVNGKLTIYSSE